MSYSSSPPFVSHYRIHFRAEITYTIVALSNTTAFQTAIIIVAQNDIFRCCRADKHPAEWPVNPYLNNLSLSTFPSNLTLDVSKQLDAALNKIYHLPTFSPNFTHGVSKILLFSFNTESNVWSRTPASTIWFIIEQRGVPLCSHSLKISVRTHFLQS